MVRGSRGGSYNGSYGGRGGGHDGMARGSPNGVYGGGESQGQQQQPHHPRSSYSSGIMRPYSSGRGAGRSGSPSHGHPKEHGGHPAGEGSPLST